MIFFLMTIAGSIPVLACLILLCFKRDSFSVRFELFLLKTGLFFFLIPVQKLWLFVPERIYQSVRTFFPFFSEQDISFFHYTSNDIQIQLLSQQPFWVPKWFATLIFIWIIGFLLFFMFQIILYKKSIHKLFMFSKPVSVSEPCKRLSSRSSSYIDTPYSFGFFHSYIILPDFICNSDMREPVEQHEKCHIYSFDSLFKLLCLVAICLHFYNPFSYLLLFLYDKLCELRCDEFVTKNLSTEERRKYGELLIAVSTYSKRKSIVWNNQFSKNDFTLKWRITSIMKEKVTSKLTIFKSGILSLFLILCCSVTAVAYTPFQPDFEKIQIEEGDELNIWIGSPSVHHPYEETTVFDFSKSNILLLTENGNAVPFDNYISDSTSRATCDHTYKSEIIVRHYKKSSGGCIVSQYKATVCSKCHLIKTQTRISQIVYDPCPH